MTARRYHWMAYVNEERKGQPPHPRYASGGAAFAELQHLLMKRGYEYGEIFVNTPPSAKRPMPSGDVPHLVVDESFLRRGDLLVVPTRLPLDDDRHADKVRRNLGYTSVERKLFTVCERYFDVLSRSHVRLESWVVERLPEHYANRADTTFRQVRTPKAPKGAWYRECKLLDGTGTESFRASTMRTAAYLLYLENIESLHGAGVFAAFGISGRESLGWARRLRTDFSYLLDEPGFTAVEISATEPPARPTSLAYIDDWKVDVMVHIAA